MHRKSKVRLALRGKHAGRGKPRIVDQQRILITFPLGAVGRIGDNRIERLVIPMVRVEQGVSESNVKLLETHVVQNHIDPGEVVGRDVYFLTIKSVEHVLRAENLGKFQKQGTAAAGRVVNLVDLSPACGYDSCEQLAHFLRGEELTSRLAGIAGVHRHQELVGIAESIDGIVLQIAEPKVAYALHNLAELVVAFRHGVTELFAVDIDVIKQSFEVFLARCAVGRAFDGVKYLRKSDIEVLVTCCPFSDILKKL